MTRAEVKAAIARLEHEAAAPDLASNLLGARLDLEAAIDALIATEVQRSVAANATTPKPSQAVAFMRETRRERIAIAAMQGLLAHPGTGTSDWRALRLCREAIIRADELIKQLDTLEGK